MSLNTHHSCIGCNDSPDAKDYYYRAELRLQCRIGLVTHRPIGAGDMLGGIPAGKATVTRQPGRAAARPPGKERRPPWEPPLASERGLGAPGLTACAGSARRHPGR